MTRRRIDGEDVRKMLARLDVSQGALADAVGITDRQMRRYLAGTKIAEPVQKLLRAIRSGAMTIEDVRKL